MKKYALFIFIIVSLLQLFSLTAAAAAEPVNATPTNVPVYINGVSVEFDAYNINDNNYFKLRDLAFQLNGTEKQFAVEWNAAEKVISLVSGKPYAKVDGDMAGKGSGSRQAKPTTSKIYLDGKEVQLTAYNIGDNNYFMLRDIGKAFDFAVDWDGVSRVIYIDCSRPYTPEIMENSGAAEETPVEGLGETPAQGSGETPATSAYTDELVRLINAERAKHGLAPLTVNSKLTAAAQLRAEESFEKYDPGHLRPDGRSAFTVLDDFGIKSSARGETLAFGSKFQEPSEVIKVWLDSPQHREIMLGDYTQIGIGMVKRDSSGSKFALYSVAALYILE